MSELQESEQPIYKYARSFGVKEKALNWTSNNYQLTRPSRVGTVMEMIRECQPKSFEEWREYYFSRAFTKAKKPTKVTKESLKELGTRLYELLTGTVIPEWTLAFNSITQQDCEDYIYELTVARTYDGYIGEKWVISEVLEKEFPEVRFEPSDADLDHKGDVDYIGWVGKKAFGIQIKPITANSNFGNYKPSERMQANFESFEEAYGGRVFIVFSAKGKSKKEIQNKAVLVEIEAEISRLNAVQ